MTEARRLAIEEDVDALEQSARSIAANAGNSDYGTVHLLAAILRSQDAIAAWLRSVLPNERVQSLDASLTASLTHRRPISLVHPDTSVAAAYDAAADVAARAGRQAISRHDVVLALAIVPAAHTRYLMEHESALIRAVRRNAAAPPEPQPARGAAHSFLDGLAVLLRAGAAGAVLVFFGAGLILRRGLVHTFALFSGSRISFASLWNSDEHSMYSDRPLSFWGYFRLTLLIRATLFAISVAILFRIMLEMRGLGVVPWPALTSGAREIETGDLQTSIGAEVILGSYTVQIWIAIGAAYFAMPNAVEVSRIRQWGILGHRLRAGRALLAPLDVVARLASRFDGATTWLGTPVAVASGFLSVVAAVLTAIPFS